MLEDLISSILNKAPQLQPQIRLGKGYKQFNSSRTFFNFFE